MVKVHKTWIGKFIEERRDLQELRNKDFFQFLKVFGEESKAVEPLPSYTKEVSEEDERDWCFRRVYPKSKIPKEM